MKTIIMISVISFIVLAGGYAGYLKLTVGKADLSDAAAADSTVRSEDDLEAIEFAARALEESRAEVLTLEGGLQTRHLSISAEKQSLIAEQQRLRATIDELKSQRVVLAASQDAAMAKLAKMYEVMKPKEAAVIASSLSIDLLVEIIPRMKERAAAKLIAALETSKAVMVTQRLGGSL